MKYTEFYCQECDTSFYVRYAVRRNVSDIDFCPSCGQRGSIVFKAVEELDGLIVGVNEVTER